MRIQDGCEKDMKSNQLVFVTVDKSTMDQELEVIMVDVIPDSTVDLEKG